MTVLRKPLRILIVEDEWIIAETIQEILETSGYEIAGPAGSVTDAMALVEKTKLHAALLDVSLRGERSFPIAYRLMEWSIPFVFMTGYVGNNLPVEFRSRPVLSKPVEESALLGSLSKLISDRS